MLSYYDEFVMDVKKKKIHPETGMCVRLLTFSIHSLLDFLAASMGASRNRNRPRRAAQTPSGDILKFSLDFLNMKNATNKKSKRSKNAEVNAVEITEDLKL